MAWGGMELCGMGRNEWHLSGRRRYLEKKERNFFLQSSEKEMVCHMSDNFYFYYDRFFVPVFFAQEVSVKQSDCLEVSVLFITQRYFGMVPCGNWGLCKVNGF